MPDWRQAYARAVSETDCELLAVLIHEFEILIVKRGQELLEDSLIQRQQS